MDEILLLLIDYLQIKGLSKSYAPLLMELINVKNSDGKIVVNASLKRDIGSRINSTVGSIDNIITKLVEEDVLIRIDRGMYSVIKELDYLDCNKKDKIEMKIVYKDNKKNIKINGGTI